MKKVVFKLVLDKLLHNLLRKVISIDQLDIFSKRNILHSWLMNITEKEEFKL